MTLAVLMDTQVLQGLQQKNFLLAQTVSEIEEFLKERDTVPDHVGLSSPIPQDVEMGGMSITVSQGSKGPKVNGVKTLDKKQVEQRIEEDRERHKRLRENIWAAPQDIDAEFDKLWEETSDLGEDDYILYEEECQDRRNAAAGWAEEHKAKSNGASD